MERISRVLFFSIICFILFSDGANPAVMSGRSVKGTLVSTFSGPSEIRRYWLQRKDRINRGKTITGRRELEEIHRVQLDRGIRNLPILATLLIREGLEISAQGGHEEAVALCDAAKMLAPGFPYGRFALAEVHWNRSKLRVDRVLAEYVEGFTVYMRNFKLAFLKLTEFFFLIGQSLLLAFLLYAFILFLKYCPTFIEGLARNFRAQIFQIILAMVKIVAILLPFFLRLSLVWAFMYWSLLFWASLEKREKIMLCVFLFFLIYIPWTMDVTSNFLDHSANTSLNLYKANEEPWHQGVKEDLLRELKANPQDTRILFTLGLISKREGNYPKAESYFKAVLSNDSSNAAALTNLANTFLAMGKVDRAIELNSKAIGLKPRKASLHFNLHRASSKKSTSLVKTDPSLQRATELNSRLIHYYLKIGTGNMNRFVIDETLTAPRLWKDVISHLLGEWIEPGGLVSVWVRPLSRRWGFVTPLFFAGMVGFFSILGKRRGGVRKCPLCGSPSRRVYPRRIEGDFICMGCYRLFVKKEGLNPKIKVKKMAQVRGYRTREEIISRILSLFSLGGGHVWRSQTIKGILLLFVFSLFILRVVYWHGLIRNPEVIAAPSPFSNEVFVACLFACFYIVSLRSISRLERRRRSLDKIRIPL
jgi:hypothetical protein